MAGYNSEGQSFLIDREVAEALADLAGPRQYREGRKDSGRTNQYGGKCIIKYNPSVGETNAGIRQSSTLFAWSDPHGNARNMTVDVGRIAAGGGGSFPTALDSDGVTPLSYRPYAEVLVGTPAAMEDSFYIDINRGQRFTVSASYVAVTAFMPAPPTGYASGSMAVTGNIGYGTAPSLAPVLYTQYVDLSSETSVTLTIPPKANVLLPIVTTSLTTNLSVLVLDNNSQAMGYLKVTGSMTQSLVLPVDAYQLVVGTTSPILTRVVYQLSV